MPIYIFENPETGETVEVLQKISEKHTHHDENGLEWRRVFSAPNIARDSKPIDAFSKKDFFNATADKNMTMGDMWDVSAELSEKRKRRTGKDKVKEKFFKSYEKQRHGVKHHKSGS
jgi:hypothetical protein